MLMALLIAFVTEVSAQKFYAIYFDDTSTNPSTRYYLSIKSDGSSMERTTDFSTLCYWMTEGELVGTGNGTENQNNVKTLSSAAFPNKYMTGTPVETASTYSLELSTTATARWLIDSTNEDTPVLFYNNKKYYIYWSAAMKSWRYTSTRTVVAEYYFAKMKTCELLLPPQISITGNVDSYQVAISAAEGCDIYYTLDGSTPTALNVKYSEPFTATKGITIKAIAIKEDINSPIAEMVLPQSLTVTLDDREDHNWTYYSGVPESVDGGYYNKNYLDKIYSPNPCDVMITYDGKGGAVSINEPETKFVYKKTLECKIDGTGNQAINTYPYTVISNPFSKRPAGQGFGGWRILSGYNHIKRANGEMAVENAILNLDEAITFVGLSTDTDNPTEIKFEATWKEANIKHLLSIPSDWNIFSGGTYETNILVLKCNMASMTINSPCTVTMVEPDGSADYREIYAFTGPIVPMDEVDGRTKIEFTRWTPNTAIDARGKDFTIGRGMKMSTRQPLYGLGTANIDVNQILKVESGSFSSFVHYASLPKSVVRQWVILGCDYDRAHMNNDNLTFTSTFIVGSSKNLGLTTKQDMFRTYSLSGKFLTGISVGDAFLEDSYYMSINSSANLGHRYLEIQGGEWVNIAGGTGVNTSGEGIHDPTITFRMKGGLLKGSIYGGAQYGGDGGTRTYIITGGTIRGWVAGGANGTESTGGQLHGASYVYVGGNARIDSGGSETLINRAVGGNVFGAGCGYNVSSTSGDVTLGTNVVIADEAYVERGVYGGGSYGFTTQSSNIYITGGTIDGKVGGVVASGDQKKYDESIHGGVYGGACQNKGGSVNIYMTDGTVYGGLYGGSNASGTLSGNVNVKITGGTIGSSQTNANVYGGGYGSGTAVNGAVNIALGNIGASTGVTVNGDVYGGGAEGKVNNSISINVNAANINGDLYGGGHGGNAEVSGNSAITMTGGTIGNVFGGGNAAKLIGNSSVTITDGIVTSNVYGGGNQAEVKGQTKVVVGQK